MNGRMKSYLGAAGLAVMVSAPVPSAAQDAISVGFLLDRALGVATATDLSGAAVCMVVGSEAETIVADYFIANNMEYIPVLADDAGAQLVNYRNYACDVYAGPSTTLDAVRMQLPDAANHMVLPERVAAGGASK